MKKIVSALLSVLLVLSVVPDMRIQANTISNEQGEVFTASNISVNNVISGQDLKRGDTIDALVFQQSLPVEKVDSPISDNANSINQPAPLSTTENLTTNDGFVYRAVDGGVQITGYTGLQADVVIPAHIEDQDVVSIGSRAFDKNTFIISLVLPESLKSIDSYSFAAMSSLSQLTVNSNISIKNNSFSNSTNLRKIVFGEKVTSIPLYTNGKAWGSAVEEYEVSLQNQSYKSVDGAIYNKAGTQLIEYPLNRKIETVILPDTLETLANRAFVSNPFVKEVTIPESVTSIGDKAFEGCSALEFVRFYAASAELGSNVFRECGKLTTVEFGPHTKQVWYNCYGDAFQEYRVASGNATFYAKEGVLFKTSDSTLVSYPLAKETSDYTIPEGTLNISGGAFRGAKNLAKVTIPSSVTAIKDNAFQDCIGIQTIQYNAEKATVYSSVFSNCNNITTVLVGPKVSSMYLNIFGDAFSQYVVDSANTTFYSKEGVLFRFRDKMLLSYPKAKVDKTYDIPDGTAGVYTQAFKENKSLTAVSMPDTLVSIEAEAFEKCTNLKSVVFSAQINSIGTYAFYQCTSLEGIRIPDSAVCVVESSAFSQCSSMREAVLGNGTIEIGNSCFEGCVSLTNVLLGTNLSELGYYAFRNCKKLNRIEIPDKVQKVDGCFGGCSALTSIKLGSECASFEMDAGSCLALEQVLVSKENQAFCSKDGVLYTKDMKRLILYPSGAKQEELILPETVVSAEDASVSYNPHLVKVVFPSQLTEIPSRICYQDTALKEIIFEGNLAQIGGSAFAGCTAVESMTIPASVLEIGYNALPVCIIYGERGTAAQTYANENHLLFLEVGEEPYDSDADLTIIPSNKNDTWDGSSSQNVVPDGDIYIISSAEELRWVAQEVNSGRNDFLGKMIKLAINLDLSSQSWTPIGTEKYPFRGSFDGQNNVISGLQVQSYTFAGLFGYVRSAIHGRTATIKNVVIENGSVSGSNMQNAGMVVGIMMARDNASVEIQNCVVSGTVSGASSTGGIVGCLYGSVDSLSSVKDCVFEGTVEKGSAGGIVGEGYSNADTKNEKGQLLVENCRFSGTVSASNAGVVFGTVNCSNKNYISSVLVRHCLSEGNVTGSSAAGGILAEPGDAGNQSALVKSCVNYGKVSAYHAGGIVGNTYMCGPVNIEECANYGTITAQKMGGNAGGITSWFRGNRIENCFNAGEITNTSQVPYLGGIASHCDGNITNCYNIGWLPGSQVSAVNVQFPGAISSTWTGGKISDCYFDNSYTQAIIGAQSIGYNLDARTPGSYGLPSGMLRSASTYSKWNFDTVWEIDRNYNRGYPIPSSIKDLLKTDGENSGESSHYHSLLVYSLEENGLVPISKASLKIGDADPIVSDNAGIFTYRLGTSPKGQAIVSKPSFVTKQLALKELAGLKSIILWKEGQEPPQVYSVLAQKGDDYFDLYASKLEITSNELKRLKIKPEVLWDNAEKPGKVFLRQGDSKLEVTPGNWNSIDCKAFKLKEGVPLYITAEIEGVEKFKHKINVNFTEVSPYENLSLVLDRASTTVDPFSNTDYSLGLMGIPVKLSYKDDDTYILTIGVDVADDEMASFKDVVNKANKNINLIGDEIENQIKNKGKRLLGGVVDMGKSVKSSFVVGGYMEGPAIDGVLYPAEYKGLFLNAKGSISDEYQLYPFGFPVVLGWELFGKGKSIAKFDNVSEGLLYTINNGGFSGSAEISGGLDLSLGVGVAKVASVGVSGSGELVLKKEDLLAAGWDLGVKVKAKLYAKVLCFKGEKTIWQYPDKSSKAMILKMDGDESLQPIPRVANTSVFEAGKSSLCLRTSKNSSIEPFKTNVFENATPQYADLGDGKRVAIWTDDAAERQNGDRAILLYSYYDGFSWSDPARVWDTGRNDFTPSVVAGSDGKAYVTWLKSNQTFGSSVELDQLLNSFDVCVATIDSNGVTNAVQITNDQYGDFAPSIAVKEGSPVIAWAKCEGTSALHPSSFSLWKAEMSNSVWNVEKVAVNLGNVSGLDVSTATGETIIAATISENGSSETTNHAKLCIWNGEALLTVSEDETKNSSPVFSDSGTLLWNQDGELKAIESPVSSGKTVTDTGVILGENTFSLLENSTGDGVVVWPEYEHVEGDTPIYSNLVGAYYNAKYKLWGDVVPLTNESSQLTQASGFLDENGAANLMSISTEAIAPTEQNLFGTGNSHLVMMTIPSTCNLEIGTEYSYDGAMCAVGEELPISFDVTNTGTSPIKETTIVVEGSDGAEISSQKYRTPIMPGETVTLSAAYTVQENDNGKSIRVRAEAVDKDDQIVSENSIDVALNLCNAGLKNARVFSEATGYRIVTDVTNDALQTVSNAILEYRVGGTDGQLIGTQAIGSIEPSESATVNYLVPFEKVPFDSRGFEKISVKLVTNMDEWNDADNESLLVVREKVPDKPTIAVLEAKNHEASVWVDNPAKEHVSGQVYLAAYSGTKTISVQAMPVAINAGEDIVLKFPTEVNGIDKYKAYFLNASQQPQCPCTQFDLGE